MVSNEPHPARHIWQLTLIGGKSANVTLMRFFKIRANS